MADKAGFQYVSRRKRKKRGKQLNNSSENTMHIEGDDEYCDVDRIITQIQTYCDEINASRFYIELKDLFHKEIKKNSSDQSDSICAAFQDIVCYGVGCIRTCPSARYQFALLVLLKEYLKISSENCCVYEPLFNKHDKSITKHFGCSLIKENEEAKRLVSRYTLFYMPHCSKLLYNNLLWASWGPSLRNVVIFGNGFSSYEQRLPSRQLLSQVMYIAKILPYTREIPIPNSFHLKDIFNDSALHFFDVNIIEKLPRDFWIPCPEPLYDEHDPEIVTKKPI